MTPFRLTRKNSPAACRIGRSNRAIAWTGFCFGAASGMIMGLWAFGGPVSPPPGFVDYADTADRAGSCASAISPFSASAISICCSPGSCRRLSLAEQLSKSLPDA